MHILRRCSGTYNRYCPRAAVSHNPSLNCRHPHRHCNHQSLHARWRSRSLQNNGYSNRLLELVLRCSQANMSNSFKLGDTRRISLELSGSIAVWIHNPRHEQWAYLQRKTICGSDNNIPKQAILCLSCNHYQTPQGTRWRRPEGHDGIAWNL